MATPTLIGHFPATATATALKGRVRLSTFILHSQTQTWHSVYILPDFDAGGNGGFAGGGVAEGFPQDIGRRRRVRIVHYGLSSMATLGVRSGVVEYVVRHR